MFIARGFFMPLPSSKMNFEKLLGHKRIASDRGRKRERERKKGRKNGHSWIASACNDSGGGWNTQRGRISSS